VKSFVILGLGECECLKSFTLMKCHGKNAPIATLSITTLSITVKKITLSITALNIVVLRGIMLNVVMLSVATPSDRLLSCLCLPWLLEIRDNA